ncbi:hypothetical protein K439DRAFT_105467 [Ramaria rubella]|nr:hypothetical protein K439DRAFT_105467 [Ramaria rubella]
MDADLPETPISPYTPPPSPPRHAFSCTSNSSFASSTPSSYASTSTSASFNTSIRLEAPRYYVVRGSFRSHPPDIGLPSLLKDTPHDTPPTPPFPIPLLEITPPPSISSPIPPPASSTVRVPLLQRTPHTIHSLKSRSNTDAYLGAYSSHCGLSSSANGLAHSASSPSLHRQPLRISQHWHTAPTGSNLPSSFNMHYPTLSRRASAPSSFRQDPRYNVSSTPPPAPGSPDIRSVDPRERV